MKQNEVVKRLNVLYEIFNKHELCIRKYAIGNHKNIYFATNDDEYKNSEEIQQALTEAIRCVELVPELVEALEMSLSYHKTSFGSLYNNEHIENTKILLKKAKEEVE